MSKFSDDGLLQYQPLFDLRVFFAILWARKAIILACVIGCASLAAIFVAISTPMFVAKAVVIVDPRETNITPNDSVLAGLGNDSAAIASQVAVIRSRELLESVFDAENIQEDPEFAQTGRSLLGKEEVPTRNMVFDKFVSRLGVEREGLTYVLNLTFRSSDSEKAARIVNKVATRYIDSQVNEKSVANAEVSALLESRIESLQKAVNRAESAVEDFKVQYGIFDAGAGQTVVQTQIDQLNAHLTAAKEASRQAATRYDQALAAGTSPLGLQRLTEILSSAAADKLRDEYNIRSAAVAGDQAKFGPRHPTLISQQAELERLNTLIVAEAERITQELKANLDIALSIEDGITSDIETLRAQSNASNLRAVELRQLERNADASRAVLDQFQQRSEETGQLEGLQLPDTRIISAATAPDQASGFKPSLLYATSALMGFALGSAIALLLGLPKPKPPTAKEVRKPSLARFAPMRLPIAARSNVKVWARAEPSNLNRTKGTNPVQSAAEEIKAAKRYARLD